MAELVRVIEFDNDWWTFYLERYDEEKHKGYSAHRIKEIPLELYENLDKAERRLEEAQSAVLEAIRTYEEEKRNEEAH